jgi:hypothetical protein
MINTLSIFHVANELPRSKLRGIKGTYKEWVFRSKLRGINPHEIKKWPDYFMQENNNASSALTITRMDSQGGNFPLESTPLMLLAILSGEY